MMWKAVLFATVAALAVSATVVPCDEPEEQSSSESYSYDSSSSTGSSYATGSSSDTGSSYSSGYSSSSSSSSGSGSSSSSSSSYSSNSGSTTPKKPRCRAHEVYNECTNGGCSPRNCTQLGFPVPCIKIDPKYCKKGCICEDGYLRNSKGICIPKKNCPSCGGDPNAVASICGNNCGNTCANYMRKNVPCPKICRTNSCECKKGYVYDDNQKKCVRPKDCSPVCKSNEVYSECVNGGCFQENCDRLGQVICVKIDPKFCKKGCKCKTGYAYDKIIKKCVLPKDCPGVCSKKHEVYSDCANGGCDAKTCAQNGIKVPCVEYNSTDCVKGCRCEDGYLRADNGNCIPRNDCPSCGGDPNAQQGCGINCGRHCSNYMQKNVPCPLRPCFINNCDCRPEYVFDDNLQKCVLPRDCTPVCKENEVYSGCVNRPCGPIQLCSQINDPIRFCPAIPATNCRGGCVCIDGYLRNSQGVCIPKDQCPEATSSTNSTSEYDCSEALQRLLDGNLKFTVNFLADIFTSSPTKSLVASPFSILLPLATCGLATDQSNSFNQIMSVLNLKSKDEIRCVFKEVLKTYESQNDFKLQLANKIYVNINNKLKEKFKTDTETVFKSEGEALDFSNSQLAADIINDWVAGKTNNLITDLVNSSMFSALTRLVLVNAIYFLGSWVKQFNPDYTSDRDFYVSENVTKPISTMFLSSSFRYAEVPSLDAKILEIPYKGGKINYVAILPNTNDGLANLVTKLQDIALLNDALNQLNYEKVNVFLPRYETSSSFDLTSILQHLGITDIFDASKSFLNDMIEGSEKLAVSAAVQKAKIKVDEVGTEAAAANAIVIGVTSVQIEITKEFNANHPFAYFILRDRSPLFAGVVNGDI